MKHCTYNKIMMNHTKITYVPKMKQRTTTKFHFKISNTNKSTCQQIYVHEVQGWLEVSYHHVF